MKVRFPLVIAACCTLGTSVIAQPTGAPLTPEPRVQRTVIEDEGSRIEELRVRGQTQRITVTPKVGTFKGYEIITPDGARDLSDGVNPVRGAAGKRVWHVLSF